jgi:putative ABC transport system ATP-binding protein
LKAFRESLNTRKLKTVTDWLIRVVDVSKHYVTGAFRQDVLHHLTFDLRPGEAVALTGPSGSGKTSLLNLLAGIDVPSAGEIWFQNNGEAQCISRLSERQRALYRRRYAGYVFQFFNLIPSLTVAENVRVSVDLNRMPDLAHEALERLHRLGLGERLDRYPAQLSGGEQQRVAIARALAHRPPLVLADEPTGNLDATNADRVMEMLLQQVRDIGATLVVATHSERVARGADRMMHLAPEIA